MCRGAATKNGHRFLTDTRASAKVRFSTADSPGPAKPRRRSVLAPSKGRREDRGQGGRNRRVVLDYEMKKRLYRDLAKLSPGRASSEQKHLVAERHGLQVVRGKIPIPDIRIEYETRDGERACVASNLPPVTTGEEIWRKKSAPDSPSTPVQKMLRNSGPCWISVN
jgi:hypothetical protein